MSTINSLLGELDIIGAAGECKSGGAPAPLAPPAFGTARPTSQSKSAVSLLREHREQEKERQKLAASINLPSKPVMRSNPLLDQIGQSTTESPTYWKTAGSSSASAHKKYSHAKDRKSSVTKVVQKKRQKGASYKEKMENKIMARTKRS